MLTWALLSVMGVLNMTGSRSKKAGFPAERILFAVSVFVIIFFFFVVVSNFSRLGITGAETGYANVTINQSVGITLITDGINFTSSGPADYRESNNSNDLEPAGSTRINISNNGNVPVNVTVQTTTDLFTSVVASSDTSFKCMINICNGQNNGADGDGATECLTSPWNGTYTDCDSDATSSPVHAIANLSQLDGQDTSVLDISITIPSLESAGTKQAIIALVAVASTL